MGYCKYTKSEFENKKAQHNIMLLVGNGFDIQILTSFHKQINTSYDNFYNFLKYQNCRKENLIFAEMKEEKARNNKSWSDFETALISLLDKNVSATVLEEDLHEIQGYFSKFLNDIISPEFLTEIGKCSEEKKWANDSLSKFLMDLNEKDYKRLKFPAKTKHYDLFDFLIVNFNYTALLDNYMYLDKKQFNPHPYKTVDRNFKFEPNPNNYDSIEHDIKNRTWSTYLMTDIIHPHGVQSIPRSILFGFNDKGQLNNKNCNESAECFIKPYWGQNDVKYKRYFAQTELFIIFGLSLGKTDKWWWENIVNSLLSEKSELIIYMYEANDSKISISDVKDNFLKEAGVYLTDEERVVVLERIFVIVYDDNTERIFLNSKN